MYTSLVILLALAACVATAPADDLTSIVSQSQKNPNPDGSKSNHETGNGTKTEKKDHLENAGTKKAAQTTKDEDYYDDLLDYGQNYYIITVSPLLLDRALQHRNIFRG